MADTQSKKGFFANKKNWLWIALALLVIGGIVTAIILSQKDDDDTDENKPTPSPTPDEPSEPSDPCAVDPTSLWPTKLSDRNNGPFTVSGRGAALLQSANGAYNWFFQSDGNLVVRTAAGATFWASRTSGLTYPKLTLDSAGNFYIVDSNGVTKQLNKRTTEFCPASVYLPNDGNLQVLDTSGAVLWQAISE